MNEKLLQKLIMFGFSEGNYGFIKRAAPFKGPIEVDINGSPISIRYGDAALVTVSKIQND